MTAGERILFEEMARLRFIVGNGLKLLAACELTTEGWRQALVEAEKNSTKIAEQLLDPLPISCPVGGKLYPETVLDQVSEARDLLQQRPLICEPARSVNCLRRGIFLSRLAQLLQLFERRFTSPIIHRRLVASHFRKQLMLLLAHPV